MKRASLGLLIGMLLISVMTVTAVARPNKPHPTPHPKPTPTATATPTPTPTPTATATPTPTPTPTPTAGCTVTVPTLIDSTGVTDVTAALNNWIASVADGSTICFPAGGTYRLTQGIQLQARHNLTFVGNGATLRSYGAGDNQLSSTFVLGHRYGGSWDLDVSNVTIHGFVLVGSDPTPGTFQDAQYQHAFEVQGLTTGDIYDNTVRAMYGDGIHIGNASSGVRFHDNRIESAGRNGVSVISGTNQTYDHNTFTTVGYVTFDVEPNTVSQTVNTITFAANTAGTWAQEFYALDGSHTGAAVDNVFVTGNLVTGSSLATFVDNGGTTRNHNLTFTNNTSQHSAAGPVLHFSHVDGLTVTGNVQPLSSGSLASFIDCTGVTYP